MISDTLTVAVIVAARNAAPWLEECRDSIRGQELPPSVKLDLRLGIDGCLETAREADRIGEPYWWGCGGPVGPYVLRNSLIEREPADLYAIFDADDAMLPTYLKELIPMAHNCKGIAGAARWETNDRLERLPCARYRFRNGVAVIERTAWERLGGYRPWPVAADWDLIQRAKRLGITVRHSLQTLYLRRRHEHSLTAHRDLGMESRRRAQYKKEGEEKAEAGELRIEPATVPLLRVPEEAVGVHER